jgi:hypothetical protein
MKEIDPSRIHTLYPPTHINTAPHEDSEWLEVISPTQVYKISEPENGAIQVHLIQDGQLIDDEIFYWHQPEIPQT